MAWRHGLKAQHMIAQGNALGAGAKNESSPERAEHLHKKSLTQETSLVLGKSRS
jgi:hypothetical protein